MGQPKFVARRRLVRAAVGFRYRPRFISVLALPRSIFFQSPAAAYLRRRASSTAMGIIESLWPDGTARPVRWHDLEPMSKTELQCVVETLMGGA